MDLRDFDNYDLILDRYRAWLECEIIDRPPVWINIENEAANDQSETKHASFRDMWFDCEYQFEKYEKNLETQQFVGDTVPIFMPNLGPDLCSTLFGGQLEFGQDTSWSHPSLKSCEQIIDMKPDFENPFWKKIKERTLASLERGKGKWVTGITDLHTNGDILSALAGPENLCMEIFDNPDLVKRACEHITNFFPQIYSDLYDPIAKAGDPATTWAPYLYKGRMYITSCDFICLISPNSFKDIILPSIIEEMKYLDKNVFHLDGPDALRHLDALLDVPDLNGLQWVFGAGNGPSSDWIEVYQKVQASGKCIDLICESIEDALKVAEYIKPEGVWFHVAGRYKKDEALEFIKRIENWSCNKK